MAIELTDKDFVPLAQCEFQHWGERSGPPFCHMRALSPEAAERVWRRTAQTCGTNWADGEDEQLDLSGPGDWSEGSVRDWLLSRGAGREDQVLVCFQPRVAVALTWGMLCDHWLLVLWTGGCVWPRSGEWVLIHDGDRFAFGRRP
jgi:hypothetical protein